MKTPAFLARLLVFAAMASLIGSGCVAVTVGTPETYDVRSQEIQTKDIRRANREELEAGRYHIDRAVRMEGVTDVWFHPDCYSCEKAGLRNGGSFSLDDKLSPGQIAFSLPVPNVSARFAMERDEPDGNVRIEVQKKLAFGFFPGHAEDFWTDENSLSPMTIDPPRFAASPHSGGSHAHLGRLLSYPLTMPISTLWSLFVVPFDGSDESWRCSSHGWWTEGTEPFRLAESAGVKLTHLSELPQENGVYLQHQTWVPKTMPVLGCRFSVTHESLFGFHKYLDVVVVRPPKDSRILHPIPEKGDIAVFGPRNWRFRGSVELSIPEAGNWSMRLSAPNHPSQNGRWVFALPKVAKEHEQATGILRFVPATDSSDADFVPPEAFPTVFYKPTAVEKMDLLSKAREAYSGLGGKEFRIPLTLPVDPALESPSGPPPVSVVEVHHHWYPREVETTDTRPYDVETAEPFADGHAAWTVTILDESKTADEIDAMVRPFIERNLREAFTAANAVSDESAVRVHVSWTVDGRALRYDGTAWLLAADVEEFAYDASSRRGTVSLRIPPHADIREFKAFARRTIGEIARDKNVLLAVDDRLPEGAHFAVVDENFHPDTRLLVVEFEVVK